MHCAVQIGCLFYSEAERSNHRGTFFCFSCLFSWLVKPVITTPDKRLKFYAIETVKKLSAGETHNSAEKKYYPVLQSLTAPQWNLL